MMGTLLLRDVCLICAGLCSFLLINRGIGR